LPDAALAQLTPQEREYKTRLIAHLAFEKDGTLATYISTSGQRIQYAPSEQEIRNRVLVSASAASIRARAEGIRTQAWMFMIAAIVAVAAGLYARFCERRKRDAKALK
jgi:hypothetical protein